MQLLHHTRGDFNYFYILFEKQITMKKIYLALMALATFSGVAQERKALKTLTLNNNAVLKTHIPSNVLTNGCDTVVNILPTDTAVVYTVQSPEWGYVSGHNSYEDVSKVELFLGSSYTAGYQVVAGYFLAALAVDGGPSSTMQACVWNRVSGLPGTVLGTANIGISSMNTGGMPTLVTFATPINVTGDFFFGLDGFAFQTPAQQDTVAIFSTTETTQNPICHGYDQWGGGMGWYSWDDPNNWEIKAGMYMGVILCQPSTGIVEITNPGLEPIIYPNPASSAIYVNAGNGTSGKVSIKVYDAIGNLVAVNAPETISNDTYKVDMNGAAAGIYLVKITNGSKTVTRKVVIE